MASWRTWRLSGPVTGRAAGRGGPGEAAVFAITPHEPWAAPIGGYRLSSDSQRKLQSVMEAQWLRTPPADYVWVVPALIMLVLTHIYSGSGAQLYAASAASR